MSAGPEREPLSEVRRTLQIDWYRCPIDRAALLRLLERSDARGWCLAGGHLALFLCTGLIAYYCFAQAWWPGFALALFAHGTAGSFFPVSPVVKRRPDLRVNATPTLAHPSCDTGLSRHCLRLIACSRSRRR